MSVFDRIADLPLSISDSSLSRRERETSSGFERVTTVITLHGDGEIGIGEDVTYDAIDHDRFRERSAPLAVTGDYTLATFSSTVENLSLFGDEGPERPISHSFRQWGLESAALDLALRQADTNLGRILDRTYEPVRFVASTRLGDPPTMNRIEEILAANPACEFKLDPTADWSAELMTEIAALEKVKILDCKAQYDPDETEVAGVHDPAFYRRLLTAFDDPYIEDPPASDAVWDVIGDQTGRISWDYPIRSVEDVRSLPHRPGAINIKPSRFGAIESLFETIEYCLEHGIPMYGGGQFELDVGRDQVQVLASLFYPDGPNDVAPAEYNTPTVEGDLVPSPLSPSEAVHGYRRFQSSARD